MKKLSRHLPAIAFIACLAPAIAPAQSEKITIRITPGPYQTIRLRMVEERETETSQEATAPVNNEPSVPLKTFSKTTIAITQKNGAPNRNGAFISEVTCDEYSTELTMNDKPQQAVDSGAGIRGKKFMATFDKQGALTDVAPLPGIEWPAESLKNLMKSFYGNLPATPIGIGETAATPFDLGVPIPVSLPNVKAPKLGGEIKYKLVSVEKSAAGRLAKFDKTVGGKIVSEIESDMPNGKVTVNIDYTINGGGGLQVNVDKGQLKLNELSVSFSGRTKTVSEANEIIIPDWILKGTIKVTITGN